MKYWKNRCRRLEDQLSESQRENDVLREECDGVSATVIRNRESSLTPENLRRSPVYTNGGGSDVAEDKFGME